MPQHKEREIPKKGTIYTRVWHNKEYKLEVVDNGGKVGYKMDDVIYKSTSAAARAIVNRQVSGPEFWGVDQK